MFLVRINNSYNEAYLAKSLMEALPENEYLLHFNNSVTETEFFKKFPGFSCKHTVNHDFVLLNGASFQACFTFGCASVYNTDHVLNSIYAAFFKEIGVPCIDIQHGFFQYGLNKIDNSQHAGFVEGKFSLPFKTMTEHSIIWSGQDGIGYLKSEQEINDAQSHPYNNILKSAYPKDYALILSNTHSPTYTNEDKYKYLYTVARFIKNHPELHFVLKPHKGEIKSKGDVFVALKQMAENKRFTNLSILVDTMVPLAPLIHNASFALSSLSSTLVSLAILEKPTFMFQTSSFEEMAQSAIKKAKFFEVYEDLEKQYSDYLKNPKDFIPDAGIGRLNKDNLHKQVQSILAKPRNGEFNIGAALKYIEIRNTIFTNFRLPSAKPATPIPAPVLAPMEKSTGNLDVIMSNLKTVKKRLKVAEESLISKKLSNLFKKAV